LFYRLNVFPIVNIPLRDRREDIRPLVRHFIEKYNAKLGRDVEEIPDSVMKELESYEYPGNVRELENLIERSVILSPGRKLQSNFNFKTNKSGKKAAFKTMEELQKDHILEALRRTKGKVTGPGGAAEILGMNDKTLYSRMTKFDIGRLDYDE
jgi:transcriptional regulator with PAS, ATPase and Fis domain